MYEGHNTITVKIREEKFVFLFVWIILNVFDFKERIKLLKMEMDWIHLIHAILDRESKVTNVSFLSYSKIDFLGKKKKSNV